MSYLGDKEYILEVARGNVAGAQIINKFGHNNDVDTGTVPESVWSRGGLWVAPTTSRTHDIVSTSTNDDGSPGGTGARTIQIFGLDASWAEQSETIVLNGTTNVPTASTYTRIFRMMVLTAGSSSTNAGTITATAQTDGTVTAEIDVAASITHMAIWTVPAGHTAYLFDAFASLNRQGGTVGAMVEFELMQITGIDGSEKVNRVMQTFALAVDGVSAINYEWKIPKVVPGPSDICINANYVSDNNTVLSAGFGAIYITD